MTACVNKKRARGSPRSSPPPSVGALFHRRPRGRARREQHLPIDLLATDSSAFAKGTVSYKYGMKPGADFTYTGYDQGLVPSKVEVYNGDTVFPQPRPASGSEEVGKSYFYYVQVDESGSKVDGVKIKNAKGKLVDLKGTSVKDAKGNYVRPSAKGKYAVVLANCTAKNQFDLVSVADTFTITGQSLDGAVLYEGDDMADTDFGFSGAAQSDYADTYLKTLNIALDGVQLDETDEVTLSIYAKGGSNALSHDVLEIGKTYVVKVDGVEIAASRASPSSASSSTASSTSPRRPSSPTCSPPTLLIRDSTFVQLVDSLNGFPCDGQGSVTETFSPTRCSTRLTSPSSPVLPAPSPAATASTPTSWRRSPRRRTSPARPPSRSTRRTSRPRSTSTTSTPWTPTGETANSFIVDLSQADPDHVDLSDIKVTAGTVQLKAADYKVIVHGRLRQGGRRRRAEDPRHLHPVTVVCDTELDNGMTVYGTASATVKVLHKVVKASDVFFSYNERERRRLQGRRVHRRRLLQVLLLQGDLRLRPSSSRAPTTTSSSPSCRPTARRSSSTRSSTPASTRSAWSARPSLSTTAPRP